MELKETIHGMKEQNKIQGFNSFVIGNRDFTFPVDKSEHLYTKEDLKKAVKIYGGESEIKSFIQGVKWQQERSYREEEVIDILYAHIVYLFGENKHVSLADWFEQFKKK